MFRRQNLFIGQEGEGRRQNVEHQFGSHAPEQPLGSILFVDLYQTIPNASIVLFAGRRQGGCSCKFPLVLVDDGPSPMHAVANTTMLESIAVDTSERSPPPWRCLQGQQCGGICVLQLCILELFVQKELNDRIGYQ